ncbi:ATPase get3 [Wickerhamiella sorbophila]|uniref:ATPase get3 n=1 Tax=Wickerhamiella sorbophila TaxID=45607 RepID=A0A2T0FEU8_9ASCO|nr:ATPase get3 [Wickerhamiella sorbophila]PRT53494.1 ATPase get3 [Wickerhamiella sorbophila]
MSLAPTVQEILDQKSLRWIFVGGKGGVGKTTNSCSVALQLAKCRENVLLISTDPAHNLSDAFGQKFGKDPSPVNGVPNLSAMEIDPSGTIEEFLASQDNQDGMMDMVQDLAFAIPGIDEALSFAEVMKRVKKQDFSVVVFDTAPTGHTLRFLQFPAILEKALGKVRELSTRFGPMLNTILGAQGKSIDEIFGKLDETRDIIAEVNRQFTNPDLTTFICVCIAEFLSLYETERMIQELLTFGIDTNTIIVNQLLFPKPGSNCDQCNARKRLQQKYLEQIHELYEDYHLVELPQLTEEVRGVEALEKFSQMLVKPYKP